MGDSRVRVWRCNHSEASWPSMRLVGARWIMLAVGWFEGSTDLSGGRGVAGTATVNRLAAVDPVVVGHSERRQLQSIPGGGRRRGPGEAGAKKGGGGRETRGEGDAIWLPTTNQHPEKNGRQSERSVEGERGEGGRVRVSSNSARTLPPARGPAPGLCS